MGYYLNPRQQGTIIQDAIDTENRSEIRLLTWYGANPAKVAFARHSELKRFMEDIARQAGRRKHLEGQLLNTALNKVVKAEVCKELAQLWQQHAEEETQPEYRLHYHDKAKSYRQQERAFKATEQQEVEYRHLKEM